MQKEIPTNKGELIYYIIGVTIPKDKEVFKIQTILGQME